MNRILAASSLFYGLVFMGASISTSYLTLYFKSIGLHEDVIGLIMACGSSVMLFSAPVWGRFGDHAKSKNRLLALTILVSALLLWLYPLAGTRVPLIIVVTVLFYFFTNPTAPMSDTIVLELAKREGFKFSSVRMAGSLGFAVMAAIAGQLLTISILWLFPLFTILRISSIAALRVIPAVAGHARNAATAARFADLFRDKKLVIFYGFTFLLSVTWAFFNSFYPVYANQIGIDTALIGLGVTVGSTSQFPFMFLFDRIYRRFGIVNILLFSGSIYAVRWFLFSAVLTPATLLPIMALHGLNYIIIYLCLTEYVGSSVAPGLRTRGQMANSLVLFGLSAIIGNLFGGLLAKVIGLKLVFLASAIICALAVGGLFVTTKLLFRVDFAVLRPLPRVKKRS
jgi:PPP family 3-phenylpropionic acid transporter